jgi:hypothetical protein
MRKINEEMASDGVAANRIGDPGSSDSKVQIYDKLLSMAPLDPRLQRILQQMGMTTKDGRSNRATEAVKSRIVSSWVKLFGLSGSMRNTLGPRTGSSD